MSQTRFDALEDRLKKLESMFEAMLEYTLSISVTGSTTSASTSMGADTDSQNAETSATKNLYPPEQNSRGITYAWTGPAPRTTICLNMDRSKDNTILLDLVGYASDEIKALTKMYVDGEPATLEQKGTVFSIQVHANEYATGLPTTLLIDTQKTFCPSQQGMGDDKRHLGVAIRKVEVNGRADF